MDSLKTYIVEVIFKKMGPSLIRAAIAALVGLAVAHQGLLQSLGVFYNSIDRTLTLHLDTFETWALAIGMGSIAALMRGLQHHTQAALTSQPQDGTHEREGDKK